jgi:ATP adenylyltransferase/5',5'''-P-1,P-4-tetraphosphate phosphorylase II
MLIQTIQQYSEAFNTLHFFKDQPTPAFQTALELIRQNRELAISHPEVQNVGLDVDSLIAPLLLFSHENRFIKFDPLEPTIVIKSFPASRVVYQYNPYRDPANRQAGGQRPAPVPGQKTDFLAWETFPENEHFLVWTSPAGPRYGVLVQPVPIVPNHLIVASLDHNPITGEHFDQFMQLEHLRDMQDLQVKLGALGYAMGYNGRKAGASVDHFHTQAVPKNYLPLVHAYESGDFTGTNCPACLDRFPQVKVSLTTQQYAARGVMLEAASLELLLEAKQAVLQALHATELTFNSLSWHHNGERWVEVFFPRGPETILNDTLKAGYVEMSGMLVIPKRTVFDEITHPSVGEQALDHASLTEEQFQSFIQKI